MQRILPFPGFAALCAALTSAALLLGAFYFQYVALLAPCEMCIWQRWPHGAAILFGGLAAALARTRKELALALAWLAILALALSGFIGIFHAGVEWSLWPGPSDCTGGGYVPGSEEFTGSLKIVRCDEAAWRLFGVSLAGYNALISLGAALVCARMLRRKS